MAHGDEEAVVAGVACVIVGHVADDDGAVGDATQRLRRHHRLTECVAVGGVRRALSRRGSLTDGSLDVEEYDVGAGEQRAQRRKQ